MRRFSGENLKSYDFFFIKCCLNIVLFSLIFCNYYIIVFSLVDFKPGGRWLKSQLCKKKCYAPNFEIVGDILVSACPYVCMYMCVCVCVCVCIHVRDIVLKLHVWILHGKIADTYFWFSLNYLPLLNYGPLTNKGMKFCKCRISKSIIGRNLKLVSAGRG